jgi:3-oxoacyl-(acyl-carrier-protein) synthase/acyl carrier protein
MKRQYTGLEIAVIGMSGRFPGAGNVKCFWDNLKNGIETISFFTDEELLSEGVDADVINDPSYVKAFGLLKGKEYFDSAFFNYTPDEATLMDPQTRIFHECVWEAIEDAGCDLKDPRNKIGLFAGSSPNTNWEVYAQLINTDMMIDKVSAFQLSNARFLSSRISYLLNLHGPSIYIDTTCSTSLVAIQQACKSLLVADCNIAIAGGITITNQSRQGYFYVEGMADSRDGHCRVFDADASGAVGGEGAGVVILKTLKNALRDGDNISAIIKGGAINNDGNTKPGYAAASVDGQTEVIMMAQKWGKTEPESITLIEAQGAATKLADPIEVEALRRAYGGVQGQHCALGSAKTNVGNLNFASGVTGFIKVVQALKNRQIPPSLHFKAPNPEINFKDTPFYVNTRLKEWRNDEFPLRAGVSSFGIGGTNAHVVLEEAPEPEPSYESRDYQLLLFSARTPGALERNIENFISYLKEDHDTGIPDIAYVMQTGRSAFEYRKMIVCKDRRQALEMLASEEFHRKMPPVSGKGKMPVVFMFPDPGPEYPGICSEVYKTEKAFREELETCFGIIKRISGKDAVDCSRATLFAMEYALARLLIKWGIYPDVMIGQGIGEYVMACISEVFPLEDALTMILKGEVVETAIPLVEIETLLNKKNALFVGAGPGIKMGEAILAHPLRKEEHKVINLLGPGKEAGDDLKYLLAGVGEMWLNGILPNWPAFYENERRRKVSLPTYSFDRTIYPVNVDAFKMVSERMSGPRVAKRPSSSGEKESTETVLMKLWKSSFFYKQELSVDDDFFQIGGDSLKALTLIGRIHKALDIEISIKEIFSHPSIRMLSRYIDSITTGSVRLSGHTSIPKAKEKPYYKLSSAQKRLYFLYELDKTSFAYNMPQFIKLEGRPDKLKLDRVFNLLLDRHEILRTYFEVVDGEPVQKIADRIDLNIEYLHSGNGKTAALINEFSRPFDLSVPPLMRAAIVEISPDEHILMTDMHHIITDGISQTVLVNDFMALYGDTALPALSLQYKDYSEWQQGQEQKREIGRQRQFWMNEFSEMPAVLDLPADFSRPLIKQYEGSYLRFAIGPDETDMLRMISAQQRVSMFMLILSVYTILLSKLSNQEDIVVGINSTGRHHADLENMMGMFVNTLPLRSYSKGALSYREFLADLKNRTLACFDNQSYQFEELIDDLKIERDSSRNPLFEVMIAYQNFEDTALVIPGLTLSAYPVEQTQSKFDLSLLVLETSEQLLLTFEYSIALFRKETIEMFRDYFNRILSTIVADLNTKISDL